MDFTLSPEVDDFRRRVRAFVDERIIPLEADPDSFDEHENIRLDLLEELRAEVKAAGLWAPQMPLAHGGQGLDIVGMAASYEEMGRSLFGPVSSSTSGSSRSRRTPTRSTSTRTSASICSRSYAPR